MKQTAVQLHEKRFLIRSIYLFGPIEAIVNPREIYKVCQVYCPCTVSSLFSAIRLLMSISIRMPYALLILYFLSLKLGKILVSSYLQIMIDIPSFKHFQLNRLLNIKQWIEGFCFVSFSFSPISSSLPCHPPHVLTFSFSLSLSFLKA